MTTQFAAIPTMYNGVQFRSRLEARWAAFFDLIGWQWEYEPFDLNGWIPDFLYITTGNFAYLGEVKPVSSIAVTPLRVETQEEIESIYRVSYRDIPAENAAILGINIKSWWETRILYDGHLSTWMPMVTDTFTKQCPDIHTALETHWRTAGNTVQWNAPSRKTCAQPKHMFREVQTAPIESLFREVAPRDVYGNPVRVVAS